MVNAVLDRHELRQRPLNLLHDREERSLGLYPAAPAAANAVCAAAENERAAR
jgi:hypothetical protein